MKELTSTERRKLLKLLMAAGLLAPTAASGLEARTRISADILAEASKLLDRDLDEQRLRELVPAVRRNLDFFQIVRDLDIDDGVEPAPIFHARYE